MNDTVSRTRTIVHAIQPSVTRHTMPDIVAWRAGNQRDEIAFTFLNDAEHSQENLTFAELDSRARKVAAALASYGATRQRALLLLNPGLDYVAALYGCLYAGVTAVPAYPPTSSPSSRKLPRFAAILENAQVGFVLSAEDCLARSGDFFDRRDGVVTLDVPAVLANGDEMSGIPADVGDPDRVAIIQYTSGSVAEPCGVMLTHQNLMHTLSAFAAGMHDLNTPDFVALSWVPPYHDMGLIGGLLQPVFLGRRMILMSPLAFLQQPARWLQAISRYRVTTSMSPNFGYQLCVDQVEPDQIDDLDLSCWKMAINGAEPVRAQTIDDFVRKFSPYGFRRQAFMPAYGLAETTLMISSGPVDRSPRVASFDTASLEQKRVTVSNSNNGTARRIVSCGMAIAGSELVIVDPDSRQVLTDGKIGEIWIRSPAVGAGYWGRPSDTDGVFRARLSDGSAQNYLRTGDLGFIHDRELFVTGRLKDLIIIRGRNHYPHDIEFTVENSHPALQTGCGAAFSIDVDGEERLVIVHEVQRARRRNLNVQDLVAAVVDRVVDEHDVSPYAVVLARPGAVPKTSSGKIRRRDCKQIFLNGELRSVGAWTRSRPDEPLPTSWQGTSASPVASSRVEQTLVEIWTQVLGAAPYSVQDDFIHCGGDSLAASQLLFRIHDQLQVDLSFDDLFTCRTIAALAQRIRSAQQQTSPARPSIVPVSRAGELAPSLTQSALWMLDRLEPELSTSATLAALRIRGPLDVPVAHRVFNDIVRRHESLRTRFPEFDSRPVQVIDPPQDRTLPLIDLSQYSEAVREDKLRNWLGEESGRHFDLASGPLLRISVLRLADNDHVLAITAHHIIHDGWSWGVMAREFSVLYEAFKSGQPSTLADLPIQFADFAAWQRQHLRGETLDLLRGYWTRQLADLPTLQLPTDFPRPAVRTTRGDARPCNLSPELSAAVADFSRREGVTPFMTLLAAFQLLLARYSGQQDIVVGSPVANRTQPETASLIGYLINVVALRTDLSGDPDFHELVRRARQTTLDAFDHQEITFDQVVEAIAPPRDLSRHPVFQAMFVLQKTEIPALDDQGLNITPVENMPSSGASYFDLMLELRTSKQGFRGCLNFNSDLFRADTIDRMVNHFHVLLKEAIIAPDCPVSRLPLVIDEERRQLIAAVNDTAVNYPHHACINELIERQVERTPNAPALIDGSREWTYNELNERANRLAHQLRALGVGPEQVVAVRLPRSWEFVVAILGVLKAGGTYLPLDPRIPAARLQFTLEDADVGVVVTVQRLQADLPNSLKHVLCLDSHQASAESYPVTNPARQANSNHLAYVIYTSGSTGRPKGVMVEHRALVNYTCTATAEYQITAGDRVLQFASASFDAHVEEIFPCLTAGGTLVVRSDDMLDSYARFLSLCDQWKLTVLTLPTSYWHELTAAIGRERLAFPESVRLMILGGEPARPDCVANWFQCVPDRVRLLNTYGPTETTVVATVAELHPVDGQSARVPIGRTLANMRAYVLDEMLQPVPIGIYGELYVGGDSVARGYLNHPELTRERFLRDPFVQERNSRMYRTGDVVRWRADGCLEFVGRADRQVKLRGYRVEPAELEQVLREHPTIKDAAVVSRQRTTADCQLVAYVVGKGVKNVGVPPSGGDHDIKSINHANPSISELQQFLAARVPDFMIPTTVVAMDALPTTASGKVDRTALPSPDGMRPALPQKYAPPRNPTEATLAEIWSEVLGVRQIGIQDDFFLLGGHSLLATQVVSRIHATLGVDLPLRSLFNKPTIASVASAVNSLRRSDTSPALPTLSAVMDKERLPLSFSQERMWLVDQLQPPNAGYNIPVAIRLKGPLNKSALEQSVQTIVDRHEALRTTIQLVDDEPVQVVSPDTRISMQRIDLTDVPLTRREEVLRHRTHELVQQPFDLSRGPLLRVGLLEFADSDHLLLFTKHHVVSDAWSFGVFVKELLTLYNANCAGESCPLKPLPMQYSDFAAWQRHWFQGTVLDNQLHYWRDRLHDVPVLDLPTDRARPAVQSMNGAEISIDLDESILDPLRSWSQTQDATLCMTMLAAFVTLLHRYTSRNDIAVGFPVANRRWLAVENMIGTFVNTLVIRTQLSGDLSFAELVKIVRDETLAAYEHQDLPFEKLVKELQPHRDLSHSPFVQVMFNYVNISLPDVQLRGLDWQRVDVDRRAALFDLTLTVFDTVHEQKINLEYNTDLFDDRSMRQLMANFQELLHSIAAAPEQSLSNMGILPRQQRQRLVCDWNDTTAAYPADACLHDLVAAQAARAPAAVAVEFEGKTLTYSQLDKEADTLARYLRSQGVGVGDVVGVGLPRSEQMVVALLGILKSGAAYLPLDITFPAERLAYMVADSGASVLITDSGLVPLFDQQSRSAKPHIVRMDTDWSHISNSGSTNGAHEQATSRDLAYLMYTSGSTGQPKGVQVCHTSVVNFLCSMSRRPGIAPDDTLLSVTTTSFDISVLEIFLPLITGAKVVMVSTEVARDGRRLAESLTDCRATMMQATPATWQMLLDAGWQGARSLNALCGGEALSKDLADQLLPRVANLWNLYGPTETTVWSTVAKITPDDDRITIGRPIDNTSVFILDRKLQPVPVGIVGELYIGGAGVAKGYHENPELTYSRFVPDPFSDNPDARLYRTGDSARYRPDGQIEYLGRKDHQAKIRGFRVELGEIEAVLRQHPAVADTVAAAYEDSTGSQNSRLAAYVIPRSESLPDTTELREYLQKR
ncbi:MAG: amino acid adenylation domain-containing protein, partial [Planctomycetota bacterium]|nr:amino acid adenylation domain-containing protein [Planctomycetota bacterium]